MSTTSHWQRLAWPVRTYDAIIVGTGIMGSAAAHFLCSLAPSMRIALVDAGNIAAGASGRNAGFCIQGTSHDYADAVERLGRDRARALYRVTQRTREILATDPHGSTYELQLKGGIRIAASEEEAMRLHRSAEALQADGFAAALIKQDELEAKTAFRGGVLGLLSPEGGMLQPARLVRRMALASGADILSGHEVQRVEQDGPLVTVETHRGRLQAPRVLLALNAYLPRLLPEAKAWVTPIRAQMCAMPSSFRVPLPYPLYTHDGYFYVRNDVRGRLLVGGARHLFREEERGYGDATTSTLQQALRTYVHEHLRANPPVPEYTWAGTMGYAPSGVPFLSPLPHRPAIWVAGGFTGHGMAFGPALGELVAQAWTGPAPRALELFPLPSQPFNETI